MTKQILPILLCYILMTSQVFAISGGPQFGSGVINPIGTYSGMLVVNQQLDYTNPVVDPVTGDLVPSVDNDVNAIGLFTLGVPTVSVATGAFLLFVNGTVYNGTIVASVDPDSGRFNGLLQGTFRYVVIVQTGVDDNGNPVYTPVNDVSTAAGPITASIRASRNGALSSARFQGTATLDVIFDFSAQPVGAQQDRRLLCTVTGFRQSATFTSVTTIDTGTGG